MKRNIITLIISAACILYFAQGCTTSRVTSKKRSPRNERRTKKSVTRKEVSVRLSSEGRIYVGDRYTGLKKMVKQLKADGAKKSDRIIIYIPTHTSPESMKAIGRKLASNNYVHILFKQEQKPSVIIGSDPFTQDFRR